MEYGRVERPDEVDFSLPPDDRITDELLLSLGSGNRGNLQLYVGCAKWANKEWVGKVYPEKTKHKDFLAHYARQFNAIELNAMFYNLQPRQVIEKWASLADENFRFCPKFSNTISHTRQLRDAAGDTELFIGHMRGFGARLGPSFLQLPDSFAPGRLALLRDYLRGLPRDFQTCVELRSGDWYAPAGDIWESFRELGVGAVITDTAGRRDALHMKLTAPFAFIRFAGNNLHPTDYPRIDAWVDRIKTWIERGLREVYFFVHSHEEIHTPELARHAIEQFNLKCGTRLRPPELIPATGPGNLTLF